MSVVIRGDAANKHTANANAAKLGQTVIDPNNPATSMWAVIADLVQRVSALEIANKEHDSAIEELFERDPEATQPYGEMDGVPAPKRRGNDQSIPGNVPFFTEPLLKPGFQ